MGSRRSLARLLQRLLSEFSIEDVFKLRETGSANMLKRRVGEIFEPRAGPQNSMKRNVFVRAGRGARKIPTRGLSPSAELRALASAVPFSACSSHCLLDHSSEDEDMGTQWSHIESIRAACRSRRKRGIPPPTGVVALVFADVQSSTTLWEQYGMDMADAVEMHYVLIRQKLRECNGYEVKTEGDGTMVAFQEAADAVRWCVAVQRELMHMPWPKSILADENACEQRAPDASFVFRGLRLRMGVHVGEPLTKLDPTTHRMDYFGPCVNVAARIAGAARGGEIFISEATHEALRREGGGWEPAWVAADMGEFSLKGVTKKEHVLRITHNDLLARFLDAAPRPPTSVVRGWGARRVSVRLDMRRNSMQGLLPIDMDLTGAPASTTRRNSIDLSSRRASLTATSADSAGTGPGARSKGPTPLHPTALVALWPLLPGPTKTTILDSFRTIDDDGSSLHVLFDPKLRPLPQRSSVDDIRMLHPHPHMEERTRSPFEERMRSPCEERLQLPQYESDLRSPAAAGDDRPVPPMAPCSPVPDFMGRLSRPNSGVPISLPQVTEETEADLITPSRDKIAQVEREPEWPAKYVPSAPSDGVDRLSHLMCDMWDRHVAASQALSDSEDIDDDGDEEHVYEYAVSEEEPSPDDGLDHESPCGPRHRDGEPQRSLPVSGEDDKSPRRHAKLDPSRRCDGGYVSGGEHSPVVYSTTLSPGGIPARAHNRVAVPAIAVVAADADGCPTAIHCEASRVQVMGDDAPTTVRMLNDHDAMCRCCPYAPVVAELQTNLAAVLSKLRVREEQLEQLLDQVAGPVHAVVDTAAAASDSTPLDLPDPTVIKQSLRRRYAPTSAAAARQCHTPDGIADSDTRFVPITDSGGSTPRMAWDADAFADSDCGVREVDAGALTRGCGLKQRT